MLTTWAVKYTAIPTHYNRPRVALVEAETGKDAHTLLAHQLGEHYTMPGYVKNYVIEDGRPYVKPEIPGRIVQLEDHRMTDRYDNDLFRKLPAHMQGTVKRYVEDRLAPGHFLTAVLTNDLYQACSRADEENEKALADYIRWLFNYAPVQCWGSRDAVSDWLKGRKDS